MLICSDERSFISFWTWKLIGKIKANMTARIDIKRRRCRFKEPTRSDEKPRTSRTEVCVQDVQFMSILW